MLMSSNFISQLLVSIRAYYHVSVYVCVYVQIRFQRLATVCVCVQVSGECSSFPSAPLQIESLQ